MSDMIVDSDSKLSIEEAKLLKNALLYNVELFSGGDEIWPDQCDYAISRLELVKMIVQDHCRLLGNDLCFSAVGTPEEPNCSVMVTLHYACKQLSELQTLIAAFQPACRSVSKHIKKKRAEILKKLELFLLKSEDIIQGMASLEEVLQQSSSHNFSESCAVNSSLTIGESSGHRRQQQQVVTGKSGYASGVRLRPPYLTLVRDGYVEGQVIPRLNPVEEEHAMPLDTDKQEQEDIVPDNILPFMKSAFDPCCLTANNYGPHS